MSPKGLCYRAQPPYVADGGVSGSRATDTPCHGRIPPSRGGSFVRSEIGKED
jgi:hypothetical protein